MRHYMFTAALLALLIGHMPPSEARGDELVEGKANDLDFELGTLSLAGGDAKVTLGASLDSTLISTIHSYRHPYDKTRLYSKVMQEAALDVSSPLLGGDYQAFRALSYARAYEDSRGQRGDTAFNSFTLCGRTYPLANFDDFVLVSRNDGGVELKAPWKLFRLTIKYGVMSWLKSYFRTEAWSRMEDSVVPGEDLGARLEGKSYGHVYAFAGLDLVVCETGIEGRASVTLMEGAVEADLNATPDYRWGRSTVDLTPVTASAYIDFVAVGHPLFRIAATEYTLGSFNRTLVNRPWNPRVAATLFKRDARTGVWTISGPEDTWEFRWASGAHYQPLVGDFNGDGKTDIGLRDSNTGAFHFARRNPYVKWFHHDRTFNWGATGDHYQPLIGDFNADGLADIGLRDPNNGCWYLQIFDGGQNYPGYQVLHGEPSRDSGQHVKALIGGMR